jgi:hypothetical protein
MGWLMTTVSLRSLSCTRALYKRPQQDRKSHAPEIGWMTEEHGAIPPDCAGPVRERRVRRVFNDAEGEFPHHIRLTGSSAIHVVSRNLIDLPAITPMTPPAQPPPERRYYICSCGYDYARVPCQIVKGGKMRECFGSIYPDLRAVEYNKELVGRVFSVHIPSFGLVHQAPRLTADLKAWEDCRNCEVYQSCYDFSNAKLSMVHALRNIP